MGYTIVEYDDEEDLDREDIIDEDLSLQEVYSSFIDYLSVYHNIFCEETGLFYTSGKWFRPDDDDELWEEGMVIHVPTQDSFEEELRVKGFFLMEEISIKIIEV